MPFEGWNRFKYFIGSKYSDLLFEYGTQIFGSTECGELLGNMFLVTSPYFTLTYLTLPYLTLLEQDGRQMVLSQYGLNGKSVRKNKLLSISKFPNCKNVW